ncbi:arylsulfatase [Fulvivirgaceae bacterium BMA10]|uniref:Arylsulfatase n=1 Tax=Splendidivirga corallicola TaxID=3051826 RepID=A0ABT8KNG8_9BACT|nr:arylsulfatase [Fulvivirgaceae bacterium BMA10]
MGYPRILRYVPLCFLISVVSCNQSTQEKSDIQASGKLPNIIYVLADDLGYGDVSSFNGRGKIKTPNLDQLAAEGMKFIDAHTSSAVCTPTRYGIMTGRYNWRSRLKSGVLGGTSPALISQDRSTVASMLKAHGYHTAFIGKWHLGWNWSMDENKKIDFSKPVTHTPNDLGFDYAYGHSGSLDMAPYVYVEDGMATAVPTDTTENRDFQGFWRKGLTAPDFIHEDVTPNFFRRAISYVEERSKESNPFFLYLPLPSPHTPILPTEEWQGKSELNPYGDFVIMIDAYMGKLMQAVKDAGVEENTLIIFTSDNGCSPRAKYDELIEKGHNPSHIFRGHKADIFEGGHRVPFITRWPRVIEPGTITGETICTTDLMATCAEIISYQLKDNEGEDSFSLLPLFRQVQLTAPVREATVHHSINGSFAIRKGKWKLILCPGSGGWSAPKPNADETAELPPIQLYDISIDPEERRNVHAENPEIVNELRQLLIKYVEDGRSTPGAKQSNHGTERWPQLDRIYEMQAES